MYVYVYTFYSEVYYMYSVFYFGLFFPFCTFINVEFRTSLTLMTSSLAQDCNYELSQLRWGLETALQLTAQFSLESELKAQFGVDIGWWQDLIAPGGKLTWYPYDDVTGFRLDTECAFECPHRHFSHLLQIYDLETVHYDESKVTGNASLNTIMHNSLDNWYSVTCNESNWFNEECRGFTQCGMASMSAVMNRYCLSCSLVLCSQCAPACMRALLWHSVCLRWCTTWLVAFC